MFIQLFVRHASIFMLGAAWSLLLFAQAEAPGASSAQPLELSAVVPVIGCSALSSIDISQAVGAPTKITSASVVDDGKTSSYCKLQVVVDDYAKFELHLPVSAWTQRLLFGGGPGAQVAGGMKLDQFVTVAWQDLGNRGHEDDFAGHDEYRVNYGYRGMHLQVLAAKALLAKYYGQAQKFSYFNACSEPGREGMMEVQRFPEDFDGVAAGCPPINMTINNGLFYAWNILTNTGADGQPILTADKLPILHKAVLNQCDDTDGVKDGIVSDPLHCHPDLSAVECKPGKDSSTCLTKAQVHVAQELYRGAHDVQGNKLEPIGVLPGSELTWTGVIIPRPVRPGGNMGMDDRAGTTTAIRSQFNYPPLASTWKLSDLKFDRAMFEATTKLHYLYDATDPDLSGFAKAGHKLILWQGLADSNVLPAHAILYYTALQKQMGAKAVDQFARFYILPGVGHCGGGDGPAIKDFLTPLILWVERGVAPGALIAAHVAGNPFGMGPGGPTMAATVPAVPDLTRPVYPYPYFAQYAGTGSINDASNFVQGPARPAPAELFNWLGSGFYVPGYEKWCTATGTTLRCKDSH